MRRYSPLRKIQNMHLRRADVRNGSNISTEVMGSNPGGKEKLTSTLFESQPEHNQFFQIAPYYYRLIS